MTEENLRKLFVDTARSYIGCKESDGSFQKIIDLYNSQNPLPRGYKMTYRDPWCATFVSAVAIRCGITKILPPECSCSRMIALHKALNSWVENDGYFPAPGDLILYDWEDSGVGDSHTDADHVGIVERVDGNTVTVIEGNYQNAVKRRKIQVNGRYVRGYCVPKYQGICSTITKKGDYTMEFRNLKQGAKGEDVRALQILLMGRGYSCGNCGADGEFGGDTCRAVSRYQKAEGLSVDGIAGKNTMSALLGAA